MIWLINPKQPNTMAYKRFTHTQHVVNRPIPQYKLVIYFKEGDANNPANKPRVFYSYPAYDKKGEMGKTRLIHLVTAKYKGRYVTALLYNNRSGALERKWIGSVVEAGREM